MQKAQQPRVRRAHPVFRPLSPLSLALRHLQRAGSSPWVVATLAAAVLAACGGGGGGHDDAARPLDLTILHINDHHSNLDAKSRTLKLRTAGGERVSVDVETGGFARVAAAFEALAQDGGNVLKLHAGDALTGTLYFNRAGDIGEADAALMNTVCFDAFTLGNHEFDKGDSELKSFIERLHGGSCQTPVISANVRFGADSALNDSRAPGLVQPYVVVERDDQRIGLVGLTIAGKTKESSSPDAGTEFEDEVLAAQRAIDALKADGVNKIVVASHIGYANDRSLIAQLSGVDVVVGGDSHSLLGPQALAEYGVGTPAGAYAETLSNKDGEPVCLVQAWEYAQVVGELKVRFDADGRVTDCGGTPHVLIGDDFKVAGAAPGAADREALLADVDSSGFLRVTAPSATAAAVLAPYKELVDVFKAKQVAYSPEELCSRRVPGGPGSVDYGRSSATCNALGDVNVHGGDIQQWVAQAYLDVANAQYGGADISLQSGGGVRIPLQGTVTAANMIEVLPFGNMLWRLEVTGQEVKDTIEDGLHAVFRSGGSTGPYPYAGGLRWRVNAAAAYGQRASDIEVRNADTGTWAPLALSRMYRLFVLSFNAEGGDGYATLAQVPASRRLDIGVLDADVLQTYIDLQVPEAVSGLPAVRKLPRELYSTQAFVGP